MHVAELDGRGPRGYVDGIRRLGEHRCEVEDLEETLEADDRAHQVHVEVRELGERGEQSREVDGHDDDGADRHRAVDHGHTAEAVGERRRECGGQAQPDEVHPLVRRLLDPDVADARGAVVERRVLLGGPAEELDQHRARDVEALLHHRVHLGVQPHALAKEPREPGAEGLGGHQEQRDQDERDERDLPGQQRHRDQDQHDQDHVADDVAEQVREGLLGADDVVVQPADERAGLGPREKGDWHRLDVAEDLGPHVVDEELADERRDPPLREREEGVEEREGRDEQRQADDVVDTRGARGCREDLPHRRAPLREVDDLAQDERVRDDDERVEDDDGEEQDEHPAVGLREGDHSADGRSLDPLVQHLLVAAERAHHAHPAVSHQPSPVDPS